MTFFVLRKNVLFSRDLDFFLFVKSSNFKIYDVIMNIAAYKHCLKKTFITYFWHNGGGWKLVPVPYVILMKWQYNEISQLLVVDIYHF